MAEFFHMGGYAPYIWSSYGLAGVILFGLLMASLIRLRTKETTLRALEQGLPPRRRRRGQSGGDDGGFSPIMALGGDHRPSGKSNSVKDGDAGDSGGGDAGGGDGGGGE